MIPVNDMENGLTVLDLRADSPWEGPSDPKLLMEWEAAHRVFFSNLGDMVRRLGPPVELPSQPASLWREIFIPRGAPWSSLLESSLWHVSGVLVLLIISGVGREGRPIDTRPVSRPHLIYYGPTTFPAAGSSPPRIAAKAEHRARSSRVVQHKAIAEHVAPEHIAPEHVAPQRVARERKAGAGAAPIAPPKIAGLTAGLTKDTRLKNVIGGTLVAPALPLAATSDLQRQGPRMGASVVAPSPEVGQPGWRSSGIRVDVVAPAPALGAVSGRGRMAGPKVGAVAPAPALRDAPVRRSDDGGESNALHVEVVAPAPELPAGQGAPGRGKAQTAAMGGGVVGPPPSASSSWTSQSGMRSVGAPKTAGGLGSGLAVPPSPSMEGSGGRGGGAGGGVGRGLGSDAGMAVAPAPSVSGLGTGSGAGAGSGAASGRSGFGGAGMAVGPAPSVSGLGTGTGAGAGSGAASGRSGFGGAGMAVGPAPSLGETGGAGYGAGGEGSGRGGGAALGMQSGLPPGTSQAGPGGAGGAGGPGGAGGTGDGSATAGNGAGSGAGSGIGSGSADSAGGSNPEPAEYLPVRIVGLAFTLPGTSFSSSYEVFIAEKELSGHKLQMIKLVYWFLPYQQRLSEYHPDSSKMYKLRVMRDQACDESLEHMTVSPAGQAYLGSRLATDSLPLTPEARNAPLPCYRTTADDYQKVAGRH
jgi:hypothetical protein